MMLVLVPFTAFWLFAALWLGAGPLVTQGGSGARQVLGLLLTGGLYVAGWWALDLLFSLFLGMAPAAVFATGLSVLWLPVAAWLAFRVVGVHLRMAPAAAHH
jgi:hypothetical protein